MDFHSGSTFKNLRNLARELSIEEVVVTTSGGKDKRMSRAEFILRKWAASTDFKAQQAFLEIAFGRVPMITEISGPDGEAIKLENLSSLSDDVLEQLIKNTNGA